MQITWREKLRKDQAIPTHLTSDSSTHLPHYKSRLSQSTMISTVTPNLIHSQTELKIL